MKLRTLAAISGLVLGAVAASAPADAATGDAPGAPHRMIDIAGHPVPVVEGGLYDRYRSNTPLPVVAAERPDLDLSWFRTLQRQKVDIGFESWSPSFYYQNSRVTAVFTADLERLRALMPAGVLKVAPPLQVWPGRGLVALTAYTYDYCDNDAYHEIGLSIVTAKPGKASLGPLSLLGQMIDKDYWGYVLKLPVNTELARVRGVVGYNLPKWLTPIERRDEGDALRIEIADGSTGKVDVVLHVRKLEDLSDRVSLSTTSFTNLDRKGALTYGYAVSRQLRAGSSMRTGAFELRLGEGSLSRQLKTLKLGRMLRYEYVPSFQLALHVPQPLTALARSH